MCVVFLYTFLLTALTIFIFSLKHLITMMVMMMRTTMVTMGLVQQEDTFIYNTSFLFPAGLTWLQESLILLSQCHSADSQVPLEPSTVL